jgi:hypothetical protein
MRVAGFLSLILFIAAASGCNLCCCGKRASELECPTDIRQTHCWCFGEDAIFHCPCGPDSEFYGYQPTCWRSWPAPGAVWRDMHCPPPPNRGPAPSNEISLPPDAKDVAPAAYPALPNPFRSEDNAAELEFEETAVLDPEF